MRIMDCEKIFNIAGASLLPMNDEQKEGMIATLKDLLISVIIVAILFGGLFAYTQVWPPIVVVESGSMMHGDDSHIGTIDTGDIVLVKKIYSPDDITTYVEGRMKGYKTYGDYGDVIIYDCNGESIIHRAIMYLKWEGNHWEIRGFENGKYPSWLYVTQDQITIFDMGYAHKTFVLPLSTLNHNVVGDAGFITMGDHNLATDGSNGYDQNPVLPICRHLVTYDMIEGVAQGELPWFGAIKLYLTGTNVNQIPPSTNLWLGISIVSIIAASFLIDYALDHRREIMEKIFHRRSEEE